MFSTKAPNEKRADAGIAVLFAVAALVAAPPEAAGADVCLAGPRETVAATQADARLELSLSDGRRVRIAGLEASPAAVSERALEDLRLWALEGPLTMIVTRAAPDRWGRVTARVFVGDAAEAAPASLGLALVEAGWARVDPGGEGRPCLDALYRAEDLARRARRGLWAQPGFAVLDARDSAAFAGRAGEVVLVEGVVTGVGAGRVRSFVNFGSSWRRDVSIVVSRQTVRALEKAGTPLAALVGRRVRTRGLLDTRAGPRIEVFSPDALEFAPDDADLPFAPAVREP